MSSPSSALAAVSNSRAASRGIALAEREGHGVELCERADRSHVGE
jgi:hypothetical protein